MKNILSTQEACDFLGIKRPTLYKYVKLHKVPFFKIGRLLKFDQHTLEKWIASRIEENNISITEEKKNG